MFKFFLFALGKKSVSILISKFLVEIFRPLSVYPSSLKFCPTFHHLQSLLFISFVLPGFRKKNW